MLLRLIGINRRKWTTRITLAFFFLVFFACPCCIFSTLALLDTAWAATKTVTVENLIWTYEIDIEDYQPRFKRTRCSQIEDGAYDVQKDPDDGDYCTYKVDRWDHARTEQATGGRDAEPHQPEVTLAEGDGTYGMEREAEHTERYEVVYQAEDGSVYTCAAESRAAWEQVREGARWALRVGRIFGQPQCDTLAPLD